MSDSGGRTQVLNIGLYDQGFSTQLSITSLSFSTSSSTAVTLVCRTRSSPPSIIRWYRGGVLLDINGNITDMTVMATDRRNSYFDITLNICDSPDVIAGQYRCEAGSRLGLDSEYYTVQGLLMACSPSSFVVGQTVTCSCSSDMATSSIRFYKENSSGSRVLASQSGAITFLVTTDINGDIYVCASTSRCGNQERNITVGVTVPDNWASVEIGNTTGQNALHNTDYTLTCTVTAISGMNLAPSVEWVGPGGGVVVSGGNITVGEVETQGTISTLTLSFSPVLTSNGGRYVCRAAIPVPWMDSQPPLHSSSINLAVESQALFQLKIYPVPLCSTWNVNNALDLEQTIKREVENAVRERCNCEFSSTAIYSGEFSCQYTSCTTMSSCEPVTHATAVTYRAIVNGTSDLLPADQFMTHLEDWRDTKGTFLHNVFRLWLASTSECRISIASFSEGKCDL